MNNTRVRNIAAVTAIAALLIISAFIVRGRINAHNALVAGLHTKAKANAALAARFRKAAPAFAAPSKTIVDEWNALFTTGHGEPNFPLLASQLQVLGDNIAEIRGGIVEFKKHMTEADPTEDTTALTKTIDAVDADYQTLSALGSTLKTIANTAMANPFADASGLGDSAQFGARLGQALVKISEDTNTTVNALTAQAARFDVKSKDYSATAVTAAKENIIAVIAQPTSP